jgi:spore germination protein GerM
MNPEDQVRELLQDAVSDVEPRHSLDAVRARTSSRGHRSRAGGVAGAVVATAATIAVVVALGHGLGSRSGGGPAVSEDRSTAAPGTNVTVYFVGTTPSGPRLFEEQHPVPSRSLALDDAVATAVAGRAADPDYHSPWPSGTTMQRAQVSDGVLSVDLSGPVTARPAGTTRADAALALQQLVYTARAAAGEQLPVTFLVDGRRTPSVLGEPTDQPVPAASADDTLAPVSVTSPGDGATLSSPFTVQGRAAAFEANVQWELEQGGTVVKRGFATAAECCTLSPYSFTVEAPPGAYLLRVHDEDPSGGEGNGPTQDTKRVTVQ